MPTISEKNAETLIQEHLREQGWPRGPADHGRRRGGPGMRKSLPAFDPDLVEELADVAREYGPLDHDALLDRVYDEYPRFARKSVRGRGGSKGANSKKKGRR